MPMKTRGHPLLRFHQVIGSPNCSTTPAVVSLLFQLPYPAIQTLCNFFGREPECKLSMHATVAARPPTYLLPVWQHAKYLPPPAKCAGVKLAGRWSGGCMILHLSMRLARPTCRSRSAPTTCLCSVTALQRYSARTIKAKGCHMQCVRLLTQ